MIDPDQPVAHMKRHSLLLLIMAVAAFGSGPGAGGTGGAKTGAGGTGGTGGTTAANAAEVRTLDERVPAGSTFQAKFLLTQPRPIGSGGSKLPIGALAVNGVSIFSPTGDAAGAAVWDNGFLTVNVISPSGDYGTNLDYPFMMVAMTVPTTMATGSTFPLTFDTANYSGPTGPITFTDPKPGVLTVGGSVSIHNISPGGGTWPAGTVIKVEGTGFSPATKLVTKGRLGAVTYVSPTELDFTLVDVSTTMDMFQLTAQNPDGSQVTYFSYLRGTPITLPSRFLLTHTDPVFQLQCHSTATFTVPALTPGQFAAIAVQNPATTPVQLTLQVKNTGASITFMLPVGGRVMDEMTALLGTALNPGDAVVLTASAPVQILGLTGDELQGTVAPFLPAF